MGTYQPVVFERADAFGVVGSRTGSGHRPARHFHAALPGAQIDDVTFTFDAATVYDLSVDGISVPDVDGADVADLAALVDQMITNVNEHPQVSQIVAASLQSAGVMRLRARVAGTAFTTVTGETGGTGTGTPATTVANVPGTEIQAGDPLFRDAAATNPRLVQLAAAGTDVFVGIAQFRHRAGDLLDTPTGATYQPGEQIPVDPDGPHILIPEVDVLPGDPLTVRHTGTGREYSNVVDANHISLNGTWLTNTTAGNKGEATYHVP